MSQACALDLDTVDTIIHPTVTNDGQRAPGLRFGDPRTTALMGALYLMAHLPNGFTNRSLRCHVADLLGPARSYASRQMTYDLRRLRRKGLIARVDQTQRYRLTDLGLRVAAFFTKLDARIFRPVAAALSPTDSVPGPLRVAFDHLAQALDDLIAAAQFEEAA